MLKEIVEGEGKGLRSQVHGTARGGKGKEDPIELLRSRLLVAATGEDMVRNQEGGRRKKSEEDGDDWVHKLHNIWALGPRRVGPNVLLVPDAHSSEIVRSLSTESIDGISQSVIMASQSLLVKGPAQISQKLGLASGVDVTDGDAEEEINGRTPVSSILTEVQGLESSVVSGFQLATASGPLCEEPMWGLAFNVEAFVTLKPRGIASDQGSTEEAVDATVSADQYGPFSGQVHGNI